MTDQSPNRWPAALFTLAVVFLAALAGSLYWGITRTSRVSDPAYYTRGLDYGGRMQAEQATREWSLWTQRVGQVLLLQVTDAAGAPLADLVGTLTMQAPDGSDATHHELTAGPHPGSYRTPLPPLPPGGVRAVVELERAGAVLRRPLLLVP